MLASHRMEKFFVLFLLFILSTCDRSRRGKYPQLDLWRSQQYNHDKPHLFPSSAVVENNNIIALMVNIGINPIFAKEICNQYPFLRKLDMEDVLTPKLKYLKYTLAATDNVLLNNIRTFPQYFSYELERNIALKIAYLSNNNRISNCSAVLSNNCALLREICTAREEDFVLNTARSTLEDFSNFKKRFLQGGLSAVRNMDLNMITTLLQHGWIPTCEVDRSGRTPLMWACSMGSHENALKVIDVLHTSERSRVDDHSGQTLKNSLTHNGESCFHFASAGGSLSVCEYLLHDAGLDKELLKSGNREQTTPLHWAAGYSGDCLSGSIDVVRWLIEDHGCDCETKNVFGCTAAHFAASAGQVQTLQYLKSVGADLTCQNYHGHDPLTKAVAFNRNAVVEWFLEELPAVRAAIHNSRRWSEDTTASKAGAPGHDAGVEHEKLLSLQQIAAIVGNFQAVDILSRYSVSGQEIHRNTCTSENSLHFTGGSNSFCNTVDDISTNVY